MRSWFARLSLRGRAALLSFLLPGLGQVYVGRFGRALIWFVGLIVVGTIAGAQRAEAWIAPVVGGALGLCAALDAAIIAPRVPGRRL